MASLKPAIHDRNGAVHKTAEAATISDISTILGRVGESEGLSVGMAKVIFDGRKQLEAIFAEHDALVEQTKPGALAP